MQPKINCLGLRISGTGKRTSSSVLVVAFAPCARWLRMRHIRRLEASWRSPSPGITGGEKRPNHALTSTRGNHGLSDEEKSLVSCFHLWLGLRTTADSRPWTMGLSETEPDLGCPELATPYPSLPDSWCPYIYEGKLTLLLARPARAH